MRFTEALLLGSMNSQQQFHMNSGDEPGRCALETAVEANGGDIKHGWHQAYRMWSWLTTKITMDCPCDPNCNFLSKESQLFEFVYHLNDGHRWPRPKIAEWIKQYEDQYDVVEQPTTTEVLSCVIR